MTRPSPRTGGVDDVVDQIRRETRRRAMRTLAPLAAGVDREQEFSQPMWDELRDMGIFGIAFPEEVGGAGASTLAYVAALEEIAYASGVAALYPGTTVQVAQAVLRHGSPEAVARWAAPLIAGEHPAAWAFTEPQTGSDPKQLTTVARRDGDQWRLSGQKIFISYAAQSPVALVFAKVESGSVAAFLVETDQPGWTVGPHARVMSFGGTGASPVFLDDVVVPASHLVGAEDGGFRVMLDGEAVGKIRVSAINVGVAQRALDEAASYAVTRLHRGASIGEKFSSIQSHLADMQASVLAARALLVETAAAVDSGDDIGAAAAALRIVTGRAARETASAAMQICGAYGMTQEMPIERLYREAKFYEVAQGAVELQRVIVGKDVLRRAMKNT
ncbi:MAG: acyl-CoA dehydrogenase family protein [Aeromicrobium sp.]